LLAALDALGSPVIPGKTPLQEAQILLAAAAEIEHALLVEYLYAALSLGPVPAASLIRDIAVQEMCHLITDQNLLLFTGAPPSLTRQDQEPHAELDPFRFTLRPLTKEVLEEFLLAEMPPLEDMTPEQRAVMEPIWQAHGSAFHPVGLVYARIFWLFQQDDQPDPLWPEVVQLAGKYGFGPDDHIKPVSGQNPFPGLGTATTYQVDPAVELEWRASYAHGGIFESINSRATALKAIADIARQGEGLASPVPNSSHFERFLGIYTDPGLPGLPVVPLPTDPFVSDQANPNPAIEANRITHPLAVALCRVFNLRYQILLAALRGALFRSRELPAEAAIRSKYATWALAEMSSSMRGLFKNLLSLPAKEGNAPAPLAAAPPFALDGFALPDDPAALDQLLLDLHRESAVAVTAALAQNPGVVFKLTLQSIQAVDKTRFPNL